MPTRLALITGTSTGIGRSAALNLARRGIAVLAGVRKPADGDALRLAFEQDLAPTTGLRGRIIPIILDVAKEESIADAMQIVRAAAGRDGLWALVNNAGIVVPGPVEHLTPADWRRQFDVNFFGMAELTRHCIPLLRQGVATHGRFAPRIMFVSSIGGRIAQPFISPYTASKFATSALGDSLRLELYRQGIGVTVLEPGAIATAIWGKGDAAASELGPGHPARALYGPEIDGLAKLAAKTAAGAISPDAAAEILASALLARRAPARVLVGTDAKIGAFLRKWLPLSWFDAILRRQFGMSGLPMHDPGTVNPPVRPTLAGVTQQ